MKTVQKPCAKSILRFAFLALIFLAFSCSQDQELDFEENPKALNAKKATNSILKVLAKGATLKGANGIDIGPDDNLYVASVNGTEIVVMNKKNGKIIKRIGQDMGVKSPDDLVFGPDGSLYWTDILIGEVGRMTPEGVVTKQFIAPGVNPITFSAEGRLFVGLAFLGDGLYELDPNLIEPARPIIEATPENPFPLGFLNSFDFSADGYLYSPLFVPGLVVRVNVGNPGDPVSTNPFEDGTVQVISAGFVDPVAAKFGPDGILHILDQTGEVFKINTTTGDKTLFTTLEPGLDNLVFDSDGSIFMTNNDEGWVADILPSRKARKISRGGMINPGGLAVLKGKNNKDAVFEADLFSLRQFNGRSGKQENSSKGFLVPVDSQSLILPMNVSSDGNNLVVSSWFSSAVQVWDPQTNQVLENYAMAVPLDAIRFKNDILVSDIGLGGVVRASDLSVVLPMDNTNVFVPSGLATDGETVWVADWATGLIWQIGFEGTTPMPPMVVASGLSNPEGLDIDEDGTLVVVETGLSQLSRIDLTTGDVTMIVDGLELSGPSLEGFPPTWFFDGVAIGQSGDIYVSGGGSNVIYRVNQK